MIQADASGDRALLLAAFWEPESMLSMAAGELDLSLRLLRRARLLGVVAARLDERGLIDRLPRQAVDQLVSARVMAATRARVARWELDRLAWALDDLPDDVPLVAMKGCAYLLAGTPNSSGRLFADVDVLVPEAHLPTVEQKLRERGWNVAELTPYDDLYYRRWTHELPPLTHVERDVEVDLHHNILMRTARLKPSAPLLFKSAREIPGSRYSVLAPIDMTLHVVVHLFYGSEMDTSLRELVDIDSLLRHFAATEPEFWDGFWPRAVALDLQRPAFYALRYARRMFNTPVPESVMNASNEGAPARVELAMMDWLVPHAIFPRSLGRPEGAAELARVLAYVRSHWVKMPPWMLMRHLTHKFVARRRLGADSGGSTTSRA